MKVQGFYSDLLYQPWMCATIDIDPHWLHHDNLERRAAEDMSVEQFQREFEMPNQPVIIQGLVSLQYFTLLVDCHAWAAFAA